jgi:hypothetical protein
VSRKAILRLTISVDLDDLVDKAFLRKLLATTNVLHAGSKPKYALYDILGDAQLGGAHKKRGKIIELHKTNGNAATTEPAVESNLPVVVEYKRPKSLREIWREQRQTFKLTKIFEQKMELDQAFMEELDKRSDL